MRGPPRRGWAPRAVEAEDTAEAAGRVAALGGRRAAVCSEEAALEAGLVPLLEDVSDVKPNGTRFWRLAREAVPPAAGPAPRVLRVPTERLAAPLRQSGVEILPAGGRARPSRSFPTALLPAAAAALRESKAKGAVWLGPPPDVTPARRGSRRSRARPSSVPPTVVSVGGFRVGGGARAVIAGPCAVESEEQVAPARAGGGARGGDGASRRRLQAADVAPTPSRGTASRRSAG